MTHAGAVPPAAGHYVIRTSLKHELLEVCIRPGSHEAHLQCTVDMVTAHSNECKTG